MKKPISKLFTFGLTWLMGLLSGIAITIYFLPGLLEPGATNKKPQPLYWVAPMDSNYRRDQPGKSPMGMDLIPVYEEEDNLAGGEGTVRISPNVINNLGVRTEEVKREKLVSKIHTVGFVQYDEDRLIHIHPRVSGWVDKLYVKTTGDPVKKGEPLYSLYSPELVNAQEELLLVMRRSDQRLIKASKERLRALQIPDSFINELQKSEEIKQTITFFAPQNGVVDNLNIREGFYVEPGTTMLSIGALDTMWVEVEIFERQSHLVNPGDAVTMTLDYAPGKEWKGELDYIYPRLDNQTRTLRARLRFNNAEEYLKPNMFAKVEIEAKINVPSLIIPREALIRTGHQDRVVLALGEGQFKSISVNVGRIEVDEVEILSGLVEGDRVVTSAQFLLDSESSKTSDFKRWHNIENPQVQTAWADGVVKSIDKSKGLLTISRGPIKKWNRPSATLDFALDEQIELSDFHIGQLISFRFEIRNRDFVVVDWAPQSKDEPVIRDHQNQAHGD